jgi:hypothetical protein
MKFTRSIVLGMGLSIMLRSDTQAQTNPGAASAAAAAAQAALEQQQQEARTVRSLLSMDPSRIATIGLWPGPVVPCKLPKREKPYSCQRILEGPAIVLTRLQGEFIVARGDQAVAQGKRSWWTDWSEVPLALAPGEVLYSVGSDWNFEKDRVATVYRP